MESDLASLLLSFHDSGDRQTIIKAPFGYVGNKLDLLKWILPILPQRRRYVEHFGGSGAVLLNRQPSKVEIYNDACSGVTAFFRCCADPIKLNELCGRVRYMVRSREEFYWCRDTWETCTDPVERAARWYYALQNSFNKKFESFRRTTGNKASDAALQSYLPLFYPVHDRMQKVYIENLDWRVSTKEYDCVDTVHYMDPPYYLDVNPYQAKFSKAEHVELLERIFAMQGFVMISGYKSELYQSKKWDEIIEIPHKQKVSGNASCLDGQDEILKRMINVSTEVTECLYIKKEIA